MSLCEIKFPERMDIELPFLLSEGEDPILKVEKNIFEITCVAMGLITEKKIKVEDFCELRATCIELAENFKVKNSKTDGDTGEQDYLEEIMRYAKDNLINKYSARKK